jgi:hypothetical protein
VETVEKSKSNSDFSTVSTALGNPAKSKSAGFPHSHSAGGETYSPGAKHKPRPKPKLKQELSTLLRIGTFYFALTDQF